MPLYQLQIPKYPWDKPESAVGEELCKIGMSLIDNSESASDAFAEGIFYLQKASNSMHTQASFELGTMYAEEGKVKQDFVSAAHYFELAKDQKHPQADEELEKVRALLPASTQSPPVIHPPENSQSISTVQQETSVFESLKNWWDSI